MSGARVRRPLIALLALIIALVIGYTVRALRSDGGGPSRAPQPSVSRSR